VTDPAELACLLARLQQATDELPAGALPALVAQLAALAMQAAARMVGGAAAQPPRVPLAERQQDLTQEEAATVFNIPLRTVRFLSRTKRIASYEAATGCSAPLTWRRTSRSAARRGLH